MQRIVFDGNNPIGALLLSAFQPEFMPALERRTQHFSFAVPDMEGRDRAVAVLGVSDIMAAQVQVIRRGGEGLHLHAAMTGFWMVLQGLAVFTDQDGVEHAAGRFEGMLVPRGTAYAFRNAGEEDLVLLQVEALVSTAKRNTYKRMEPGSLDGADGEYDSVMAVYDARRG